MLYKNILLGVSILLLLGLRSHTLATPKNVIIIRHAEKIPEKNVLNLRGYERAGALAYYFAGTPLYNNPPISYVFAMGLMNADSSVRPIETCTPIAHRLALKLNIDFNPSQINELAQEILTNQKYHGKNVLVCMDHGKISQLSVALGAEDPGYWSQNIFDQVFMISYVSDSQPKLQKILQKLMFGDRNSFKATEPLVPTRDSKEAY